MGLDRLLYRMLTGSWGRFAFLSDPVVVDPGSVPDEVGIYVHIPFCRSVCPFCPYNKILYEPEIASRYARSLELEARAVVSSIGNAKISSVYFGGGTPLTVPLAIKSLVDLMRSRFVQGAQIAVEVHPHDVTASTSRCLAEAGVNMVSLGVESLDDHVLRTLGRGHDSASALAALDTLMDSVSDTPTIAGETSTPAGGPHRVSESGRRLAVNVDLITGIPGQTLESAASDMRRLLALGVDQVSAYPLMDFPFTSMRSRLSLRKQRLLLDILARIGIEHRYERTSVWTWTKPGSQKYSSITREDYVGIGAGAASHLGRTFWLNTFSVEAYVDVIEKAGMNAGASGSTLAHPLHPPGTTYRYVPGNAMSTVALSAAMNERESALYRLFWRCYEGGFDLRSAEVQAIPLLSRLVRIAELLGLAKRLPVSDKGPDGSIPLTVRLTDSGFFLYHLLERYYTRCYIGRLWQVCRESAFPAGLAL